MKAVPVIRLPSGFYELQGVFPDIPELPYPVGPQYALEPMAASHTFRTGNNGPNWYPVPRCLATTGLILPAPSLAEWASNDAGMQIVAKVLPNAHIEFNGQTWLQVSSVHEPIVNGATVFGSVPPFGSNGILARRRVLRIHCGKYYDSAMVWSGVP